MAVTGGIKQTRKGRKNVNPVTIANLIVAVNHRHFIHFAKSLVLILFSPLTGIKGCLNRVRVVEQACKQCCVPQTITHCIAINKV